MAPAVAALRVADASSASAGTVANASAQTPIQAASRPMLLVDMEILWRGGREGISDAWRGKKLSGVVRPGSRSEEHTSELQSLMRISYAVFCLKKKIQAIIARHIVYYFDIFCN